MTVESVDSLPRNDDDFIVKPRARIARVYPIVAIYGNETLDENGELGTLDALLGKLPTLEPTAFIAVGSLNLLARMTAIYRPMYPNWQWQVRSHERRNMNPSNDKVIRSTISYPIMFFGWKGANYHKLLDPSTMFGHALDTLMPRVAGKRDFPPLPRLLRLGVALRDFCAENNLELRPTTGAICTQLLTDKRFYPKARRKVPRATNERTREYQPGNHYKLFAKASPEVSYTAIYIDQTGAHHYHARTTAMPHADLLYAYGDFINLERIQSTQLPEFHGLYCLDLLAPAYPSKFSWVTGEYECLTLSKQRLYRKQFVYSNELPHLLDLGYSVVGWRAFWGSRKRDEGLPKYARWAEQQLETHGKPPWLKQLLLATYGTLATQPRYAESVFQLAKAGIPTSIPTGRTTLDGLVVVSPHKLEPPICNVLQRGMIEAATRSESVGLAEYLYQHGHKILQIYADAVVVSVNDEKPLPAILPEPWRIKRTLTNLRFLDDQAYVSDQETKIPGGSRPDLQKYTALRAHAPSMRQSSVEEIMEHEETVSELLDHSRPITNN